MIFVIGRTVLALTLAAFFATSTACGTEQSQEPAAPEAEPAGQAEAKHEAEHAGGEQASEEQVHHHGEGEPTTVPADFVGPGVLELPDDLRAILVAEMTEIELAMHRLLSALARGELAEAAVTGRKIHDSFVLALKLTPEQSQQLTKLLPPEFVSLDRQFHLTAAELAEAAESGDAAHAAELYARMSQGCVGCHRAYARQRFPGLAPSASGSVPSNAPSSAAQQPEHDHGHP